jgi:hypothetical protein
VYVPIQHLSALLYYSLFSQHRNPDFAILLRLLNYLSFQYFGAEWTWWRLFQKRVVSTEIDIFIPKGGYRGWVSDCCLTLMRYFAYDWNICIQICYKPNVNVKIKMFMYQFNICQLYFIIFCNIFILFLVPLSCCYWHAKPILTSFFGFGQYHFTGQ